MYVYLRIYVHDNMYVCLCIYIYRSQVPDLPLGHYATSVITERAHRQYIYLFIYYLSIFLFSYIFFYIDIYNKKHKNLYNLLYTNSYTYGIQ